MTNNNPGGMPSFYIIDGHAHIFRSYYAPFRNLTSPSGEPTKATYVFLQMLLNLIEQRHPDYLAMAVDHGDETVFRRELYPAYKATRTPPPADFHPQEQRILQLVRDAGVPVFSVPGFEADDLIATMADRLRAGGFDVFIVSKDKDLRQLLDDRVRMYDVQHNEIIDPAGMRQKLGYGPEQSIDVQTLMGDSSDNVPGIPGVGEKTAAALIGRYGSVDELLKHVDELTPKLRANLQQHAPVLEISRKLVTLRRDVPFDWSIDQCRFRGLNVARLRTLMQELGFHSLLPKLEALPGGAAGGGKGAGAKLVGVQPAGGRAGAAKAGDPQRTGGRAGGANAGGAARAQVGSPAEPIGGLFDQLDATPTAQPIGELATSAACDYRLVNTPDAFEHFLENLKRQRRFAFDTETSGLGATSSDLIGLSFSWHPGTGYYVPVRGPAGSAFLSPEFVLPQLRSILEDPSIEKVGHHIKYDLLVMRCAGIALRGVAMDTMLAAFLLDASRSSYGIDTLARDLLKFQKIPTTDLIGRGKNQISMQKVELHRVARYAAEDADITWRLAELLASRLDAIPELRRLHDELEIPLIDVLAEMEFNGVAVDREMLARQSAALGQRIAALREALFEAAGAQFNPDSPRQLAEVLFERLRLPYGRKTKTGYSTDVEVLERLADQHAVPKLMLQYRELVKLKNTYLDELPSAINPRTGRLHGSFHQTGAATGRLSMSDPNLQNVPIRTDEGRAIRLAFVAGKPDHVLLVADYSQIELRVLAHFTGEPALVRAFERDEDIHTAVAAEVFGVPPEQVTRQQRAQAKVVNFGIIYGITPAGLARRIDGMSVATADSLIRAYHQRFGSIARFMDECVMQARSAGYVRTVLGRRRPLPDINSAVLSLRNAAERAAINSVVQGSAADLIKTAMLNIHRRIVRDGLVSRMLLQVHDELVFETPKQCVEAEGRIVREEMIRAGTQLGLSVPLKVELGWGPNWHEGK